MDEFSSCEGVSVCRGRASRGRVPDSPCLTVPSISLYTFVLDSCRLFHLACLSAFCLLPDTSSGKN